MDARIFAGRYRLESLLGRSAMADVWLARDVELERPVALKLLTPEADRVRFEREARAAASLSHPNVMRIYDYGEDDGRLYIALEYLPGGTLESRLADGRPLRDDETAAIASQLAGALAHAHEHGLVHRDVKPANVLFDDEGRAKLADFGIARAADTHAITETGTIIGTAAYISPEQAAGEPAEPASDVYSFGVLLYRMLTGRLPFEAESPLELARLHREAAPPPIDTVRPGAPNALARIATDALAKDPRNRPRDGAALAERLGVAAAPIERSGEADTVVMRRKRRGRRVAPLPALLGGLALLAAAGIATAVLVTHSGSSTQPPPTTAASTHRAQTHTSPAPATSHATTSTTAPTTTETHPTTTETPTTITVPPTTTVVPTITESVTTATTTTGGG
jgi:serine/threonine protein kinase